MLCGDVPYFYTYVGSKDLHLSGSTEENFFAISGIDRGKAKLNDVDNSDIEEQRDLLDVAVGMYRPEVIRPVDSDGQSLAELRDRIALISTQIVSSAYVSDNAPARWLSLFGDTSGNIAQVQVGDNSFFAGAWGILMALEAIDSVKKTHTNFLETQAVAWQTSLCLKKKFDTQVLGYSGIGGEVFA